MRPYSRDFLNLFESKARYEVPLFQRQYVWNQIDQWQPFWEDVERKFNSKLLKKDGPPHFLGAMVLDHKVPYGNAVLSHLVIDGQQRLITFQIFLSAIRDICFEKGQEMFGEEYRRYLENDGVMEDEKVERYKVWPTNLDRTQFMDVIDAKSRKELEKRYPQMRAKNARKPEPRPPMIECYLFFYEKLLDFFNSEEFSQSIQLKIECIHGVLRSNLQAVTIELEGDDDPQVIFESLNARGQPLLPSDLLRNYIFWRAVKNNESPEELYSQYWLAFDDNFWRQEEKQGRLMRPRSDIFLQHFLSFKRKEDINIGHLFSEYKNWIKTVQPYSSVRDELKDMGRHQNFFRKLIEPEKNPGLGRLALMLRIFDIKTIYPLLLGLLDRELPVEVETSIFLDLESYIVRRAICNYTPKNYNRLFLSILSKLPEDEITREKIRNILLAFQGESAVWPRDELFEEKWMNESAYDILNSGKIQYVLMCIEHSLHISKRERIDIKSDLTIEHILPQEWITHWPLPNGHRGLALSELLDGKGEKVDIEQTAVREKLKHSFGNLTLLTHELNSSYRNAAFQVKKPEILINSGLTLNSYFLDINEWNEETIKERGKRLFSYARQIWPHVN